MTHSRWPGRRLARALAASLMLAGAITAVGLARAPAAPAAGCQNWTGTQPPNPGGASTPSTVSRSSSACDAWAVGFQAGNGMDPHPDRALGRLHLDRGAQPQPRHVSTSCAASGGSLPPTSGR